MAVCPSDCSPHASPEPAVIRALPLFLLAACLGGDPPAATPAECPPPKPADLEALCATAPTTTDAVGRANAAQTKVSTLQGELDRASAELVELESALLAGKTRDAAADRRKKELEGQIARLSGEVSTAAAERDAARAELEAALVKLDETQATAEAAQAEAELQRARASGNGWAAFRAEAQIQLCDRGGKRKHAKCHSAVTAALAPHEARFKACVDRGQATPELRERTEKSDKPAHYEDLDLRDAPVKGDWMVIFCDPTLPETTAAP